MIFAQNSMRLKACGVSYNFVPLQGVSLMVRQSNRTVIDCGLEYVFTNGENNIKLTSKGLESLPNFNYLLDESIKRSKLGKDETNMRPRLKPYTIEALSKEVIEKLLTDLTKMNYNHVIDLALDKRDCILFKKLCKEKEEVCIKLDDR